MDLKIIFTIVFALQNLLLIGFAITHFKITDLAHLTVRQRQAFDFIASRTISIILKWALARFREQVGFEE